MGAAERHAVRVRGLPGAQPIVLVHGFGCDQHMWRHVAPHFEDAFMVVTLDLIGAGASDLSAYDPVRHGALQGYADDLLAVLRELDLRDVVLVGHSVAAMIGVLAVVAEPQRFDRLVLVAPSPRYVDTDGYTGGFSESDVTELLDSLDSNYLGWSSVMAPAIMGNPDRPELGAELTASFCRTDPEIARRFARVTFLSDNRADLPRVPVPSLVLQCTDDVIAPVGVGRYVADAIPDARLVLLDATGHCPNLSTPEATTAAIADFVRGRR